MGFIISGQATGPGETYFIAQGPSNGTSEGKSIARDSSGNIYTVGSLNSSADLGIAKYDSAGTIVWQYKIDSGAADSGFGIHIDSSDNIFVVGRTGGAGSYNSPGYPSSGSPAGRMQVVKFNTAGAIQWQRRITEITYGNGYSEVFNIVSDSSGNLYIAGRYNITSCVIKLNSSGIVQWFKSGATSIIASLAIDSSNNLYVIGSKSSASSSNYTASIVKLDSSGSQLWHKTWAGDNGFGNFAGGITVSSSGYVYVSFSANTASEGFLTKLAADGTQVWQRKIASPGGYETSWLPFSTVAVDSSDNIYWIINCQYNYNNSVGFQNEKAIIAKYDSSGTQQWQKHMYVSGTSYPNAFDYLNKIIVGNSNSFYVTGNMNNKVVLAKLPTDGTQTGTYTVGGVSIIYNASTLTESAGTITLATSASTSFSTITSYTEEATTLTPSSTSYTTAVTVTGTGAGAPIASGITMGGTGLGMVISSYVAPPTIGQAMYGGYYAGSISATGNGVATHYLIIAPKSTGEASYAWTTGGTSRTGIVSEIDGYANTNSLVALSASNYPGFAWARSLTIGGYTDWYIPSKNELNTMYYNLAPTSSSATGGFTANANAVSPQPTSSWTTGNPGLTTATAFQSGGAQAFSENNPPYWSSTDGQNYFGDNAAWYITGWAGNWNAAGKDNVNRFRAIRKVAI